MRIRTIKRSVALAAIAAAMPLSLLFQAAPTNALPTVAPRCPTALGNPTTLSKCPTVFKPR